MHKGFPYLLQAFAELKHPRKRLRFAGSVRPEMKPVLDRLPQNQVEFLGSIPQTELREIMSRSHVLVLPSIDDGFGMVISQAMACGCPVIATDHSGGPDILTEGVDGWVVPIRDPKAILGHLEELAQDPEMQQRMSAAAIQKVAGLGGWERYGDQWESLLFKLTGCTA
jgi:glycosyltransferase involved in cell wall biosynthesis